MPTDPYADIASPVSQAKADPYGDIASPVSAPKPEDWQATKYGFKVKTGEAPTGGPATIREDGAINQPGEQGWKFFDPKTGVYAPAPSEPWANKGVLSTALGADTLSHYGRNLKAGWDSAMGGLYDLGSQAATATGIQAPESRMEAIRRINAGIRNSQALKNTGGSTATTAQFTGEAAPVVAASAVLSPQVAAFLPSSTASIAAPTALGLSTAAMTPGTAQERAQAGELAATLDTVLPGAARLVGKGISKGIQGVKNIARTPAIGEALDALSAKLGGKAPGEALQDAATSKYNAAWDEFKSAVAPVDAEAGNVGMDYSGPIDTLKRVLGVGQKRAPMPMPKERQEVLQGLLTNLEEAGKSDGLVDNSFQGAIDTIKWLGSEQRRLAVKHGDTEARAMLGDVRDSILNAMEKSSPELSQKATEARRVFATRVAPLFDKSEGGNFLTQIRDSATPGDLLVSGNQGSLSRIKPDKAAIIARGSSADPMLYSYLDTAVKQAKGNPRIFSDSLKKAMPAIEAISDPETLKAFQGMVKVADTSKGAGILANLGLAAIPGYHEAGATLGLALNMKPAMSGPGLVWKALQSPATRKMFSFASKLPSGSPELELIARDLAKTTSASAGVASAPNIQPLRPILPAAADTGTSDQNPQTEPK